MPFEFFGVRRQSEAATALWLKLEAQMAIMLQTGRSKDLVRVARFLDSQAFDEDALKTVLTQHGLDKQWNALLAVKKRLVK
jgi:hypothetical protein